MKGCPYTLMLKFGHYLVECGHFLMVDIDGYFDVEVYPTRAGHFYVEQARSP